MIALKGSFSDEALALYSKLVEEAEGLDFSEDNFYDFTRCVRADGTYYGTRGKCRSGTEVGAKLAKLPVEKLQKLAAHPKLTPTQKKQVQTAISEKGGTAPAKADPKEVYASLMRKQQELVQKGDIAGAMKLNDQVKTAAEKIKSPPKQKAAKPEKPTKPLPDEVSSSRNKLKEKVKAKPTTEKVKTDPKERKPLRTSEDYDKLMKGSLKDKEATNAHKRAANFGPKSRSDDRIEFERAMGGRDEANKALKEVTDFGALYFSAIRGAQRGDSKYFKDKSRMGEYRAKAATIEKAVKAMPHPEVEKYRGMSVNNSHLKALIKQAKEGGSYKSDALDSWSTNLQTADQFARRRTDDEYPNSVVFRTRNKNGASIRPFSPVPGEDEILTPSGSSYRFSGYNVIERNGEKIHIFEVDES